MSLTCQACGASISPNEENCRYCGTANQYYKAPEAQRQAPYGAPPPPYYGQAPYGAPPPPPYGQPYGQPGYDVRPIKSRVAAGLLAIFLGGIGVHKFYLGQAGMGVLYLIFCWTCIPAFIALIEGIIYLTMTDAGFSQKYNVRVG